MKVGVNVGGKVGVKVGVWVKVGVSVGNSESGSSVGSSATVSDCGVVSSTPTTTITAIERIKKMSAITL